MTLAIEPMINMGNYDVVLLDNDWTYATADGSLSSHYENTVAVTEKGCEILTLTPEELALRTGGGQEDGNGRKQKTGGGEGQTINPVEAINQELAKVPELFGSAAPAHEQEQETIVIPGGEKARSSKQVDDATEASKPLSSEQRADKTRAGAAGTSKKSGTRSKTEETPLLKEDRESEQAGDKVPYHTLSPEEKRNRRDALFEDD